MTKPAVLAFEIPVACPVLLRSGNIAGSSAIEDRLISSSTYLAELSVGFVVVASAEVGAARP